MILLSNIHRRTFLYPPISPPAQRVVVVCRVSRSPPSPVLLPTTSSFSRPHRSPRHQNSTQVFRLQQQLEGSSPVTATTEQLVKQKRGAVEKSASKKFVLRGLRCDERNPGPAFTNEPTNRALGSDRRLKPPLPNSTPRFFFSLAPHRVALPRAFLERESCSPRERREIF